MNSVFRKVVVGAVSSLAVAGGLTLGASGEASAQSAGDQPAPPAAGPAAAQVVAPNQIARIIVEGNQRIEAATVLSYLLIQPGDTYDPERVDLSLKTLFGTGLFADVRFEQRGADLAVVVVENPIINRVIFEGNKAVDNEKLLKEVQAAPRSVFTTARVQADVQRIVEVYRRSGRFAAQITPQVRELDQNRVDLIFSINEGPTTGIEKINFIGNNAFSDRELRSTIVTEESSLFRFFSNRDSYDPDQLEFDREQLRQLYTNNGYADFRVVAATAELTPDQRDFFVTFTVDEGVKYEFGEVTVETKLERLPAEFLRAVIPIRSGAVFNGELLEKSEDAMTFAAGTAGYANVQIRPRLQRDPDSRKVNIVFEVDEGPRVFVERIDVIGNTSTVDPVIRREMQLAEGDSFNRILIERSQAQIRRLGFFKEVEITERAGSQPDRAIVEVKVEEQPTGELAFAAGFSSTDSFLFEVNVTQRNLRGRGQFLRLNVSTSSRRRNIELRFGEPKFLGRDLALNFDLYSVRSDFLDEASFLTQTTGTGLRLGFPLTQNTQLGLSYTLRQDEVEVNIAPTIDVNGNIVSGCTVANAPSLCRQEGSFLTSVLGYSFLWDRRNSPIRATRGFDMNFTQEFAGLGGDVNYIRSQFDGTVYRGIIPEVTASLKLSAGYIFGWNDDEIRINDRFFKGGQSFRGFDIAGLGPRQVFATRPVNPDGSLGDTSFIYGDSLGGKAYGILTAEVTVPLGLPKQFGLAGALFVDAGTVGFLDDGDIQTVDDTTSNPVVRAFVRDAAALRASAGVSIFWDSPFGPVRFDFAQILAKEEYDQTETFRFSQSTRF
jgi:outer membrane protein insertion porin family